MVIEMPLQFSGQIYKKNNDGEHLIVIQKNIQNEEALGRFIFSYFSMRSKHPEYICSIIEYEYKWGERWLNEYTVSPS